MSFFDDLQRGIRRNGAPVTAGIVILAAASFLLDWLLHLGIAEALFFSPARVTSFWTFATYPFALGGDGRALINLLFGLYWIWMIGSQVEREMGTPRFAAYWVAMSIFPAVFTFAFTALLGLRSIPLGGIWLPEAAITVAWATRNPNAIIQLIVFPIQAKWIGIITTALVLFEYGTPVPLLGVAAILHLGIAYAIASNRVPFFPYRTTAGGGFFGGTGKKVPTRHGIQPESFFDDVRRREKDRKEREELRKLFERSLIEDPDDKKGRDSGS